MSTRKKRHLVAGAIIGGLLLGATLQTGTTFALSDTSSTTNPPAVTQTTDTPDTDNSGDPAPSTPPDNTDAVADGSSATQTADNSVDTSSTSSMDNTSDPGQPTDPTDSGDFQDPNSTVGGSTTQVNNTTVTNTDTGTATTGDAKVANNSQGGDATTGDAADTTTLVNTVASSSSLNGNNLQTFTMNVNGNQNGNIIVDPGKIQSTSLSNTPTSNPTCAPTSDTTINNTTVNNLVNLLATTGNAIVENNGKGGNATSGNATTEADIINLIEALVSDKQSFLGVININGNLNGNILLPTNLIDSLLASANGTASGNTRAANNINVNNQINLTAASGTAAVTGNGVGGNATSGSAVTLLNTCNLVNSNIVGGNVLLVFVNVMGHWYGLLMNEPAGTTNAALGGGISQDTTVPASRVTATNNETVNNVVNLTSITGNATVANNRDGGDATTGSATAIADVVNILGSQINLSGWLGILVINVFGTWDGNLGVQTAPTIHANGGSTQHQDSNHNKPTTKASANPSSYSYYIVNPPVSFQAGQFTTTAAHVLGDAATNTNLGALGAGSTHVARTMHNSSSGKNLVADFLIAGISAAAAIAGGTRFFTNRHKKLNPTPKRDA